MKLEMFGIYVHVLACNFVNTDTNSINNFFNLKVFWRCTLSDQMFASWRNHKLSFCAKKDLIYSNLKVYLHLFMLGFKNGFDENFGNEGNHFYF